MTEEIKKDASSDVVDGKRPRNESGDEALIETANVNEQKQEQKTDLNVSGANETVRKPTQSTPPLPRQQQKPQQQDQFDDPSDDGAENKNSSNEASCKNPSVAAPASTTSPLRTAETLTDATKHTGIARKEAATPLETPESANAKHTTDPESNSSASEQTGERLDAGAQFDGDRKKEDSAQNSKKDGDNSTDGQDKTPSSAGTKRSVEEDVTRLFYRDRELKLKKARTEATSTTATASSSATNGKSHVTALGTPGTPKILATAKPYSGLQAKWDEMFNRLLRFKAENDNCLVPNRYSKDPALGAWVSTQRRQVRPMDLNNT